MMVKGPDISIYFDDVNFESSYLVNPNFTLIAKLSDQTGLNTTAGIGHKLEAIVSDDQTNAIDLSNSFVGDLNSGGKTGTINYKFTKTPGDYKSKLKHGMYSIIYQPKKHHSQLSQLIMELSSVM